MNFSGSECSSGCESGWTMYLDQFSEDQYNNNRRDISHNNIPPYGINYKTEYVNDDEEEEEDEDMSMVSDASSGPPHFHEDYCFDENGYIFYPSASQNTQKNKEKRKINEQKVKKQSIYLDDTASSPFSNFPKVINFVTITIFFFLIFTLFCIYIFFRMKDVIMIELPWRW